MKSSWSARIVAQDVREAGVDTVSAENEHVSLASPVRRAIARTRQWLLSQQHTDGYWCAELEGDTILESEYILLLAFLGEEQSEIAGKAADYMLEKQLPTGGWAIYPDGPVDISASVKAYFALKLTGHDPASEPMQLARAAILTHGGADAVNSFTRFYLALLGQISYDDCPCVPPEMVLMPKWFPFNLWRVSAWSRTMIVTLSIMSATRPVRNLAPERGIRELFLKPPSQWPNTRCPGARRKFDPWSWFFRTVDRGLKICERWKLTPLRKRALAAAEGWMKTRFAGSDGLGAIFPPMVWSILALKGLGYADDSEELRWCRARLDGLVLEEEQTARLQPCKSPVWDTAITLLALSDSGLTNTHSAVKQGCQWLLDKRITKPGDWSETVDAEPGAWCFEHDNDFYPDVDDTSMVMMALSRQLADDDDSENPLPPELGLVGSSEADNLPAARREAARLDEISQAIQRAENWLLAMQNSDGGWAAFDKDNNCEILCRVPFADHNAMIDPSSPDLTARVLEALGQCGRRPGHPAVDRALAYLRQTQEADGSWFGRWGVNYIYGTWQVLQGLAAIGIPQDDPLMVGGINWLVAHQQSCGGWGESPDSYADPSLRGQGVPTASQTAWALLGLIESGQADHPAVARGIRFLAEHQQSDGTWNETEFTGTGFPQVFYLRYHYYPIYFPLMALSRWALRASGQVAPSLERRVVHAPGSRPQLSVVVPSGT